MAVYLVVAVRLTVALDIAPVLAVYSPAVFPLLSLCGVTVLALRGDHRRRLGAIETVRQERKGKRQVRRQSARQAVVSETSGNVSGNGNFNGNLDVVQAGRQAKKDARLNALVTFYADNPDAGPTEAGRAIGVARQTIYTYLDELEEAGRINRENGRVKVLR